MGLIAKIKLPGKAFENVTYSKKKNRYRVTQYLWDGKRFKKEIGFNIKEPRKHIRSRGGEVKYYNKKYRGEYYPGRR